MGLGKESCPLCSSSATSLLPSSTDTAARLRSILRSDACELPPDVENLVKNASAALARYDETISCVEDRLKCLRDERSALTAHIHACKSISAPIRRLPAELLTEVFRLCSPFLGYAFFEVQSTIRDEVNILAQSHLIQLSQVCSYWHKLVMGTPELWSSIAVDTTQWRGEAAAVLFSLLVSTLEHSGRYPLTLSLRLGFNNYSSHVWRILKLHASRWRMLFLHVHPTILAEGSALNFPLLETLVFHANSGSHALRMFAGAPRLTQVDLWGSLSGAPELPWNQIQKFAHHSGSRPPLEALPFIQHLPLGSAAVLSMDGSGSNSIIQLSLQPPPTAGWTSAVDSLSFTFKHCPKRPSVKPTGTVFQALTLPHLRHFYLTPLPRCRPPSWDQAQFLALAQRSGFHTNLVTLKIHVLIQGIELLEILAKLPALQILDLSDVTATKKYSVITNGLLRGLTICSADMQPLRVPCLRQVIWGSLLRFTDDALFDFISSRVPHCLDTHGAPFDVLLKRPVVTERELGEELAIQISELVAANRLVWKYHVEYPWMAV